MAEEGFTVEAWRERPRLHPAIAELWEAFSVLSASRPVGFGGIGYIPLAEMTTYATVIGYERVADFIGIMRTLDAEFVNHQNRKNDDGRGETSTDD